MAVDETFNIDIAHDDNDCKLVIQDIYGEE